MIGLIQYISDNRAQILALTLEHIRLTAIAVGIAILIGVPLGIFVSYVKKADKIVIGFANIVQAIPSMALLGLAIPLLGIGALPAIVMVIIYALLPIVKNTYTGISSVSPQMVDASKAIGLTRWQILRKVKLPMALSVIMAGIRISSVTAVGTMTMAAFIGAGGLGYMVFSGIRTVNHYQILAGAIPACILALLVDAFMGMVEKLVTPVSLHDDFRIKFTRKKQNVRKGVLALVAVLMLGMLGSQLIGSMKKPERVLVLGGKDFTEQELLVHLYADYIEAHSDISVVRKSNLGGSQVAYEALKKNEIDMYVDYTGTIYGSIFGHHEKGDQDAVYRQCIEDLRSEKIAVMKQTSFNNTYTLAVRRDLADLYHLDKISDLLPHLNKLRLGCTIEFPNRSDTMGALQAQYPDFRFGTVTPIDGAPRFTALMNDEVDVVDAFSTEGLLKKYDLKVLKDEDQVFVPYYAVPLVYEPVLEKYPELQGLLDELSPVLTEEVMVQLNYEVDVKAEDPAVAAHQFLVQKGLIDE